MESETAVGSGGGAAAPAAPLGLSETSARLEREGPAAAIGWAVGQFGRSLALACSFQDCVIVDLAVAVAPAIEVIFLDTGFHFPETLDYVELVRRRYQLNLVVTEPDLEADPWPCGTSECCLRRKVEPLGRALEGRAAWVTGLKRCDAPTRSGIQVVEWDQLRQMVKVNPLAAWSDQDVADYVEAHRLPLHPLFDRGYLSIGCAPTTSPVAAGSDARSGRWASSDKTECGLHA